MTVYADDIRATPEHIAATWERIKARDEINSRVADHRSALGRTRRNGRRQSARTRERISRAVFEQRKARTLADGEVSPLRRLRLERGLSMSELARRALVGETTIRRAELTPEQVAPASWTRLAVALDVPAEAILPEE